MHWRDCLLALAGILAIGAVAGAQEFAPGPNLSLQEAVELAWERNPALQGVRAEVPAARARLQLARSQGRLAASTTTFVTSGSMPNLFQGTEPVEPRPPVAVPPESQFDQNLMLMYPLSTGGRVGAQIDQADYQVRAAQAEVDQALLEVGYQVRRSYWQVLLNEEFVKIAQENLREQQERLRVDEIALEVGRIPAYYVLRDKAEVAAAQQQLTNAQRDLAIAVLQLRQDMGLPMEETLQLTDALVYAAGAPPAADSLVLEAYANRPALSAASARVVAAQRQVALKRSAFRLQVNAALMADAFVPLEGDSRSFRGGYTAGIIASLPLLDGGARRAEVAEAEAMVARAEADREALKLEVSREVHEALLAFHAADQNVRTAEAAVAAAEEDARIAWERYEAGKAINLEPLSALAALVAARTNYAQALFAQRVTLDAVNRAVGELP